ncbi:protein kinase [Diplonema papillatum]|nr:protein kinase [Diplonema papillatum]
MSPTKQGISPEWPAAGAGKSPKVAAKKQHPPLLSLEDDLTPQREAVHGRRKQSQPVKTSSHPADVVKQVEAERQRDIAYEQKQREKNEAINRLLLNLDEETDRGAASQPSSAPPSRCASASQVHPRVPSDDGSRSPQHGRRALGVNGGADNPSGSSPAERELQSKSEFVLLHPSDVNGSPQQRPQAVQEAGEIAAKKADPASSDDEDNEGEGGNDSEFAVNNRMQEYKQMLTDIDVALTCKERPAEDFGENADCPPALDVQDSEEPLKKFMLAGATLRLDVAPSAPLSQRAEVLRSFLDDELGTDAFLQLYRVISEDDESAVDEVALQLPENKRKMIPLVKQLAYCDDQVNLNQG